MPTALGVPFALVLAAAPALAQYDPLAPRPSPRLRGTVVAAGGPTNGSAIGRFIGLAGGGEAEIVVWDPEGALETDWSKLGVAEVEVITDLARIGDARAVWFELPETQPVVDSSVAAAGTRILERGGIVGASATLARAAGTWRLDGTELKDGLDWFRGAFVLTGYDSRDRKRLADALAARPHAVALTIPAHGALTIDERWLTSRPARCAQAFMAATEERAMRVDAIGEGRERTDMLTYQRVAQQRARGPFPAAVAQVPEVESGTLVLIGGGAIPEDVLRRFVQLAGGKDAKIVYVPCAEQEELAPPTRTLASFRRLGAGEVRWIHTKDRAAADAGKRILDPLRDATGIWFGGGRQWNLVDSYQNTKAHELMEGVLARGGVIAGSSAGASIQAEYLCRGNPLRNHEIMWEGYDRGLGFLPGVGVDQHFSQRERQKDMESFVTAYPQLLGIGLDEGTALIVGKRIGAVVGTGEVWFYDRRAWSGEGEVPLPVRLGDGGRYDLAGE